MSDIEKKYYQTFESIRKVDDKGHEYWLARELAPLLEYQDWRNFCRVIDKAKTSCKQAEYKVSNHFGDITKMVTIGLGAQRKIRDIRLSRYACYLIVQNADPSKAVIANGQTYFAIQTRKQELQDETSFTQLSEDERRIILRHEMTENNKALSAAAKGAGVKTSLDYAIFQDHGYKGLYGGIGAKEIHGRKGLKKNQKILDHMGSSELAANLFRATQTEEKLRRDQIKGKINANHTHSEVGKKVRKTIKELGGTMPELLPTPHKSIGQLEQKKTKIKEETMKDKELLMKAIDNYDLYTPHERKVLKTLLLISIDDVAITSILKLSKLSKVSRPVVYKALAAFIKHELIEEIKDARNILNAFKLKRNKLEEIQKHYEVQRINL
jgi:DNA-damage-inducible protein D